MTLEGVNIVLTQLKQTRWQDVQRFETLVHLWPDIVGPVVSAQTRPFQLNAQGVLQVATSSGVWAQNLAFERIRILEKVNAVWKPPVKDIHFSARQWYHSAAPRFHPALDLSYKSVKMVRRRTVESDESDLLLPANRSKPKDSQEAFARWAQVVQRQSMGLVRCPICQCHTPMDELKRWNHCALCISRPEAVKHDKPLQPDHPRSLLSDRSM